MVTMHAKPYTVIPAALRRRCGLRAGDGALLAVFPGEDALAAYSFAVVDQAPRSLRRRGAAMTTANAAGRPGTPQQAVVEVALALLERMGLSPADLTVVPNNRRKCCAT
jgi:hypothetical protein